jgi:hypothetical protein
MKLSIPASYTKAQPLDAVCFESLRVVPLRTAPDEIPEYRLLDADTMARVKVTEISDSGSVPRLRVQNDLSQRLFLIDGQELLGAKQNRILNTDILVPAASAIEIPVSCVEQGRWRSVSSEFSLGKQLPSSSRSGKAERVRRSLAAGAGFDAEQHEVWREVSDVLESHRVCSPSSELNAVYRERQKDMSEIRKTLTLPEDATGAAVYFGEEFMGVDMFDRPATLGYFWNSLADSYTLDWLAARARRAGTGPTMSIDRLLEELATEWDAHDSPGEGQDCRVRTKHLTASCLLWEREHAVHIQAFPVTGEPARESGPGRPRMHRRYGPR